MHNFEQRSAFFAEIRSALTALLIAVHLGHRILLHQIWRTPFFGTVALAVTVMHGSEFNRYFMTDPKDSRL
jgi:hypothetical protein